MTRITRKFRWPLLGAAAAALVLVTTSALAGSGVGGVFNLGQTNTVDATSILSGNPGANPQLRVATSGSGAAVRGDSASATGLIGLHTGTTGSSAGVQGDTASTDGNARGVFGRVTSVSAGAGSAGVYGLNNSSSGNGYGVFGRQNGSGVGVFGSSPSGQGVFGASGSSTGVSGQSVSGSGVYGTHAATTGAVPGIRGDTYSTAAFASGVMGFVPSTAAGRDSAGVFGQNNSTSDQGFGVRGVQNGFGIGVEGSTPSGIGVKGKGAIGISGSGTTAGAFQAVGPGAVGIDVEGCCDTDAVGGNIRSSNIGLDISSSNIGLIAFGPNDGIQASATATEHSGIYAHHDGPLVGYGVFARSEGGDGVHAYSEGNGKSAIYGGWDGTSGSGWAGWFAGNVHVDGAIFAGTKDFRIDDPLDPAHKYLQHTSVESPDMMDIYNGNVTTDGKGFATIRLPRWFQALNRTFRYQLTILGHASWDTQARVWDEIAHNRFAIRTNHPQVRVSWQVTGVRHDPYANANRTPVELAKPAALQGSYIHPELYGKPRRLSESRVSEPPVRKP
jgi:hypothetical protein